MVLFVRDSFVCIRVFQGWFEFVVPRVHMVQVQFESRFVPVWVCGFKGCCSSSWSKGRCYSSGLWVQETGSRWSEFELMFVAQIFIGFVRVVAPAPSRVRFEFKARVTTCSCSWWVQVRVCTFVASFRFD